MFTDGGYIDPRFVYNLYIHKKRKANYGDREPATSITRPIKKPIVKITFDVDEEKKQE